MKQITTLLFLIASSILLGQNLIINPSFETYNECPWRIGAFSSSVSEWSIPNMGSTDFFSACSENENTGIKNYNGYQKAKSGSSYSGIYVYTDKNYREYIQGKLSKVLEKGKKYKMTFYLSLADKSSYALKDIQVLITEEQLKPCYKNNSCEKTIKPSKATKKQYKVYSNRDDIYFSDKRSWMKYSFEFTAEGYENYFSIGNFYRNPKTKKHKVLSTSPLFFSYYYIDDVSIEAIEKEVYENVDTPKNENKDKVLKVNKIYKFNNVLFNFDKADLLKVSLNELDELYLYLNENSALSIEIYGHTDNVGTNERNKELSEQRAKAVADYLISLGLNTTRIKSFGFGSSKPVAENKTEKGRQLNRRVEFKILKYQ